MRFAILDDQAGFPDKPTGKVVTVINTHMDHKSDAQRRLAASMIRHRAQWEAEQTSSPVIAMGDFNSPPDGDDSGAFQIATAVDPGVTIDGAFLKRFPVAAPPSNFKLVDLRAATPRHKVSGHFATFTGFVAPEKISNFSRIDFIFGNSDGKWYVVYLIWSAWNVCIESFTSQDLHYLLC